MPLSLNFSANWIPLTAVGLIIFIIYFLTKKGTIKSKLVNDNGTPTLNAFSINFTDLAERGTIDPVIGRQDEIDKLIRTLARRNKNNAILIGSPGVGKTAIVEGLALKLIRKEVPETLANKKILALEVSKLLSDTKYRGEFEKRLRKIIEEISSTPRSIVLFIDEIHSIVQSHGTEGSVNFADILKPALARGNLQMIGATTTDEYNKYIKPNPSLERRFQPIFVGEPNKEETLLILQGVKDKYRQFHKVEFTDASLKTAVEYSLKNVKNRQLPDKAIDAIDEAAAMVRVSHIQESIPQILYQVAIKAHPEAVEIWKQIQQIDNKICSTNDSDEKKQLSIERECKEKKLENIGMVTVDSDDIKTVISEWSNNFVA